MSSLWLRTWVFAGVVLVVCSINVSQARFLEGNLAKKEPRSRLSSPPCATLGTHFIGSAKLGKHGYTFNFSEKNGILYSGIEEGGGMELHKLHVLEPTLGPVNHGDAVSRGNDGIGRVAVHLTGSPRHRGQ